MESGKPTASNAAHQLPSSNREVVDPDFHVTEQQIEVLYRALFEQSNDAVFILDITGKHRHVNRRASALLGYTPAEMIGLTYRDLVVPEQHYESLHVLERLLAGEIVPPYERLFRHKDGHHVPVEVNVQIVRGDDGEPLYIQSIARDISHRKRVENALWAQYDELDRFFNVTLDLLCIADMDGRFIKINRSWEAVMGYAVAELEGRRFLDFVHPDDLQATQDAIATLASGTQVLNFTNRYRTRNGDYRYLEWRSHPYGQFIYAAARDITEDRRMVDHLRRSEANLRAMLAGTWQSFVLIDRDYHIVEVNAKAKRAAALVFGKEIQIGDSIYDYVLPDDLEIFTANFTRALQGEVILTEKVFFIASDRKLHFEFAYHPMIDDMGVIMGVCMSSQEITERKRMEEKLHASEARHRALVNAIPDLMFRNDRAGRYLDFHSRNPDELFASSDQIIGRFIADLLPRDVADTLQRCIEEAVTTGREVICEYELPGDGTVQHFDARMIVSGEDEVLSIVRNITERKQVAHRELEIQFEKERLQLLTVFIQDAAHEFRTPLSIISSGAYLMARADDAERRQEKLKQIEQYVQQIAKLVDMLLLMTRLESSEPLREGAIEVGLVLQSTCWAVMRDCPRQHDIRCEFPPDLPPVAGDAEYLAEAFRQILENACRFTPEDGSIMARAGWSDEGVWIDFLDDGPGIAPEALPHIFETFWRHDSVHTTPGFGLGLSIAQKIITHHGGYISVESVTGQGSAFHVVLPIKSGQARSKMGSI